MDQDRIMDIRLALRRCGEASAFGTAPQSVDAWAELHALQCSHDELALAACGVVAELLTMCAELVEDERARVVKIIDRRTGGLPDFSHVRESMEAVRDQITEGEHQR